jgi:hypothetical protein
MVYVSLVRTTARLLLLPALGCSTADGLDTGAGAGDTGGQDPEEKTPPVDGDACGPELFSWKTDEPVAFEAASMDPDGDPMRHYWWTPDGMLEASSTEVVLRSGDHHIVLLSVDGRGAHDATSLAFTRRCT